MEELIMDIDRCKGCLLCVSVCPVHALTPSEELGAKGYQIVAYNSEKCIKCGSCYKICPDYVFEIK